MLIAAGPAHASPLLLQGQDVGGDIVDGRAAERELRHVRMRRQHETGETIAIEAWRLSDRAKGRRTGLGPLLVGRNLMAGRAPPYGQAAPVRGVAGGGFIVVYCEGGGGDDQRGGQGDQCCFEGLHGLKV